LFAPEAVVGAPGPPRDRTHDSVIDFVYIADDGALYNRDIGHGFVFTSGFPNVSN